MYEHPEGAQSRPRVCAGVYQDASCVANDSSAEAGAFCLVDVLFSVLADTAALPFTLYTQVRYGNFHPRLVEPIHEREHSRAPKVEPLKTEKTPANENVLLTSRRPTVSAMPWRASEK